ncbi:MAG: lysine 2,3-aminomutase [Thiobacillus sp.]|jgi:KamA family protein|uniref:KamA family radical SAM protein n=1 Tax=Thiobacillus sp. TaxID=924 RepID=UPI002893D982|nr:lysine 2,3-aminomutase [Thiobacillus sp.]MDT3708386.1 lysine 2,3-aminomutase [Thiobacillus sp.]
MNSLPFPLRRIPRESAETGSNVFPVAASFAGALTKSAGDRLDIPRYKAYSLTNFRDIPQMAGLPEALKFDIEVVGQVLPFKVNNFVLDQLIDWERVPEDPLFVLTFPQRAMLAPAHYDEIAALLKAGADKPRIKAAANRIQLELNPHPAGQLSHNVPSLEGEPLAGMQHKYRETVLFFPSQGQTCHAYCSFCFRWPQFVGLTELKFASREVDRLIDYLRSHPEVSDVLFTGGDPMVMSTSNLARYIEPLLEADLPGLRRIRIGTKALSYWPYRFLDEDGDGLMALFERITGSGRHLAVMAHFNHPRELEPEAVQRAIARMRQTGAVIRTQSPLLRHINDDPARWAEMWNRQVDLGCVPYYMFLSRDTGAHDYFSVPLVRAWEIYRQAYQRVSGLCRTVRGPSMSADPGKVQVLGTSEIGGEKVLQLRFLQGRNPDWVHRPFFAAYDESATWLNELKPAFGESRFFFEDNVGTA